MSPKRRISSNATSSYAAVVREFRGEHLQQAIILEEPAGSVSVKAQSLELFDDGVVLRWVLPGQYYDGAEERDTRRPRLQDEIGTKYRTLGGHGGGNPRYSGQWWIVPAVPANATRLEVLGYEYPVIASLV